MAAHCRLQNSLNINGKRIELKKKKNLHTLILYKFELMSVSQNNKFEKEINTLHSFASYNFLESEKTKKKKIYYHVSLSIYDKTKIVYIQHRFFHKKNLVTIVNSSLIFNVELFKI